MEKTRHILSELLRFENPLLIETAGEFTGTLLFVLISLGSSIQIAISGGALNGYFLGSLTAGIGFALAIYVSGQAGRGHLNPAITIAYALLGKVNWRQFLLFITAQFLGAFSAAVTLASVYHEVIVTHTTGPGSSALFTNGTGLLFITQPKYSHLTAFFDEMLSASIFIGGILAITDRHNWNIPYVFQPLLIGLQLTVVLTALSFNDGGVVNPARDFGPRCFLGMAGMGSEAFQVDNYYFWIPLVAPCVGAVLGTICYYIFIGNHMKGLETVVITDDEEFDRLESSD